MQVLRHLFLTSLLILTHTVHSSVFAAAEGSAKAASSSKAASKKNWQTDYRHAVSQAIDTQKMLVVYFEGPKSCGYCREFEANTLADPKVIGRLQDFVCLRLSTSAEIIVDGKSVHLLRHPAFAEMHNRPGVAILDMTDKDSPHFHQVVSVLPFTSSRFAGTKYSSQRSMLTLLSLPHGTLTQRTMIYAVRMHPEAPASAHGERHDILATEANLHSHHQASIGVQGHHNWDSRFHRINSKLPSGVLAQEVVAESWPGEGLVEACEDCVHSWRQSPGHWSAVRSRHPIFGFDIKRGRNGIWYATGIFGRRS